MTATTERRYSQNLEQDYIRAACKGIERGRFLDIGAFHAEELSNTRALFERGWTGVLVEPSPNCVAGLARAYWKQPGMVVIAAVVRAEGDAGLHSMTITNDAVSTQNLENERTWKDQGGFYGEIYVPAITIPEILNQFGAFDFVSIDTEGSSTDLFKELLRTEMFPKCICVEHDDRHGEICPLAHDRGYVQIYASNENLVFARS